MPASIGGLVSVVMPACNSEKLLAESVSSLAAQTFKNWELLIVDDASCDATLSIAERLSVEDPRIRCIHLDVNGGVAHARNVGMEAARGQYLAFLDSDDLWLPDKLAIQTEFMKRNDVGFTFTRYRSFNLNGYLGRALNIPDHIEYRDLLKGNVIGCLTVMIDREKIPSFKMPRIGHEDYVTWLKILKDGHVAYGIQEDLARYRVSSLSVSGNKKRSAAWTWKILREVEGLPLTTATWCFAHYSAKAVCKHIVHS
jgi:teichuronic acid biosynthesis glycosyltransferase TuaG